MFCIQTTVRLTFLKKKKKKKKMVLKVGKKQLTFIALRVYTFINVFMGSVLSF